MTEDTKRALEIIQPIADVLKIGEITADNNLLYINDNAIGIGCNSTYATVMEFIGYCIVKYSNSFRYLNLTNHQLELIKRYWLSSYQLKRLFEGKESEDKE